MTDSLAARIRECANIVGNGDSLARKTAIPRSTLEAYLTGDSEPKASRCAAIAEAAGVSLDWLIAGKQSASGSTGGESPEAASPAGAPDYAYIPLYDTKVSTGHGSWTEGARELTKLAFTRYSLRKKGLDTANLSAVRVGGDSMEPLLSDGDTVLVDHSYREVRDEAVYVIRLQDHLYAKRLQRRFDGSIAIISENRAYTEMTVPKEQLQDLDIVGRVVWASYWMV